MKEILDSEVHIDSLIVTDKNYFNGLLLIIGGLAFYNLYAVITTNNFMGLLPITIQFSLLFLLISKSKHAQKAIKIWAIIFIVAAPSIRIFGILIQIWARSMKGEEGGIESLTSNNVIFSFVIIIIGVIVLKLNKGMGEVKRIEV